VDFGELIKVVLQEGDFLALCHIVQMIIFILIITWLLGLESKQILAVDIGYCNEY
jgi:hypothetical protein